MVTPICYNCGVEISKENTSEEHLLSNSIGGHKKSKLILCGPCNIQFSPLDAALAQQFNMFMVILKANRDRGESRPVLATEVDTQIETILTPDGKSILRHPIEIKKDGVTEIHAGTKKRLRQELERKKKTNPNINVEKSLAGATFSETEVHRVFHSFSLSDMNLVLRGLAKIAVNHYIVSTGVIADIAPAIRYVAGKDEKRMAQILNGKDSDEIAKPFHHVNIVGNKSDRILYAYIALFNVVRSIVLLNEDYEGPDYVFSEYYGIDGGQEPAPFTVQATREQITQALSANLPKRK